MLDDRLSNVTNFTDISNFARDPLQDNAESHKQLHVGLLVPID